MGIFEGLAAILRKQNHENNPIKVSIRCLTVCCMFHFVCDSKNLALTVATFVVLVTGFPVVVVCIDIGLCIEQMNRVSSFCRLNYENNEFKITEVWIEAYFGWLSLWVRLPVIFDILNSSFF